MSARAVVFDIGGVLVDWKPHLAWMDTFDSRAAVEAFMDRVAFKERNARADGGARFSDLAAEVDDPQDRKYLSEYVARFTRTVQDRIEGTWDLLDRLRDRGVETHAITNWSAETWPEGLRAQPRLADVFGVTVVSGQLGIMKPDAQIFHTLCDRAGLSADACVFIDDGMHNVKGAMAAGMDGIHFTGASALESDLRDRGVL
ncbi:HAD family hydrolase [Tropicimonas sp. S265A]|uniref:HAD family hydrolase n=1 Tax=Tropicimonas sp. S265A TaxID=3415134 RepID=UPI003C7E7259